LPVPDIPIPVLYYPLGKYDQRKILGCFSAASGQKTLSLLLFDSVMSQTGQLYIFARSKFSG
jgi:hypothetical protein